MEPLARALSTAALLVVSGLAGCVAEPTARLSVRPGDEVLAELIVWDMDGIVFPRELAGGPVAAACLDEAGCAPGTVGMAWYRTPGIRRGALQGQGADATLLPGALAALFSGLGEGELVRAHDARVFGEPKEALIGTYPRDAAVTRFFDSAVAYGQTWGTDALPNGTLRLLPREGEAATLQVPRWCNERFCLFSSELTGWNETHLFVRHEAVPDTSIYVAELDTYLTVRDVTDDLVRVDGNDARAGRPYEVWALVRSIRVPPSELQRAPDLALTTVDGETLRLSPLLGRPIVLEFFASWCPSCKENTRHLNRLVDEYGDAVTIVAIDVDPWESRAAIQGFVEAYGVRWPIAVDPTGAAVRDYNVASLSTEVIVSPDGNIVHVETGVADHDRVSRILHDQVPPHEHTPGDDGP